MKVLSKISAILCLCLAVFASCESPDYETGRTPQVDGLMGVTIQIPGNPSKYSATKAGPYAENEEIIVKVPTTEDDPLDVTRLQCYVNVQHNCYVTPAIGGEMDFTEPYQITVVDALGNKHHNTIRVVPTPPKVKVAKLWGKSGEEMQTGTNATGLALWKDYLAVQVYNDNIKLYDRATGAYVKDIESASSFMMHARTDDGGHLLTARENIYGAGFMVYRYDEATNEHVNILNYAADDGCPLDLGYNFSVKGDVTKGVAYIYGTCPDNMEVYYWKLQDGQLVTPAAHPIALRYGPAGSPWTKAPMIERASLDDDSNHYIAYNHRSGNPDEHPERKSHFAMFTPFYEVTNLNQDNHWYRILGFDVFSVEGDTYLALLDHYCDPWSGGDAFLRLFDITNPKNMELGPDDSGYDKFALFKSEGSPYATNYNDWGDVATCTVPTSTGYDIYISVCNIGFAASETCIRTYKMSWFRQ